MIHSLELKNFRQHRELAINFAEGVNAIRGANEAGKTTVIEAIAYAFFGARALRQSFSEVVSWTCPEATLQVKLTFQIDKTYIIQRSKSGAELRSQDGGIRVVGQTEVTRQAETLLGVNADTATRLMLANQTDIRGILEGGAANGVTLIERLANLQVIDALIETAQEKLPCGSTAVIDATLIRLQQGIADFGTPTLSIGDYERDILKAEEKADRVEKYKQDALNRLRSIADECKQVRADQAAYAAAETEYNIKEQERLGFEKRLEGIVIDLTCSEAEAEEFDRKALEQQDEIIRKQAYKYLTTQLPPIYSIWDGDEASFTSALKQQREKVALLVKEERSIEKTIATKTAKLIKDKQCALCGKDIADVPEVVAINAEIQQAITRENAQLEAVQAELEKQNKELIELETFAVPAAKRAAALAGYSRYIDLDHSAYPPNWKWKDTLPDMTDGPSIDYRGMAKAMRARVAAATRARSEKETVSKALDACRGRLAELLSALARLAPAKSSRILSEGSDLTDRLAHLEREALEAQHAIATARAAIQAAEEAYRVRCELLEHMKSELAQQRMQLEEVNVNNAFIKKLRTIRPKIADKLWSIVLASVSNYFSGIRGTKSVVSRSDNGFRIDGQEAGGYSGSTLDALGLAIRISLTRTFLPNAQFMILDEPAAACDDQREANMLGLIAACGFPQVLLVTHSDLADTFANNVIQL